MRNGSRIEAVLIMTSVGLLVAAPAFAYLDPGSGSFITQVLIASVVGGLVAFRVGVKRAFDWVRSKLARPKP